MGRRLSTFETAEDVPTTPQDVDRLLAADPSITHVGLIHCETSTGILNPLPEIAAVVARHRRSLIVDAMSSFAAIAIDARTTPFDALVAASGKCVEGPPGMGFVFVRKSVLERCAGNSTSLALDLHDQWTYMERTTQWRYTPPTHVVVAFNAALDQLDRPRVASRRGSRATRGIARRSSRGWPSSASARSSKPDIQAPIIVTFHAPVDPAYTFKRFYDGVRDKGFILYPGKLTQVETFRVGCIGAIGPDEMRQAVNAVRDTLAELGIRQIAPVPQGRARRRDGAVQSKAAQSGRRSASSAG